MVGIRLIRLEGGVEGLYTAAPSGAWLKSYTPDSHGGRGSATWTMNADEALKFEDAKEAIAFYRLQSVVKPWREDGKANRPLTAFTVEIVDLPA